MNICLLEMSQKTVVTKHYALHSLQKEEQIEE